MHEHHLRPPVTEYREIQTLVAKFKNASTSERELYQNIIKNNPVDLDMLGLVLRDAKASLN